MNNEENETQEATEETMSETSTIEADNTPAAPADLSEEDAAEFAIDVDFESYEVPAARARRVRAEIIALKNSAWLFNLFSWVKETGTEFQNAEQGELLDSAPAKRLNWGAEHVLCTTQLVLDGSDLEITVDNEKFLTLQQLPKGDEVLISYYNPAAKENFKKIEAFLHNELKNHLKTKTEKNKAFQERFAKQS